MTPASQTGSLAGTVTDIHFLPFLPVEWLAAAALATAALLLVSVFCKFRGAVFRAICTALFLAFLSGPSLVREQREPVKDVVAVVVDRSASQALGERQDAAGHYLSYVKKALEKIPALDVRVAETPNEEGASQTKIFKALDDVLADVPVQQRAGAILITDGQIHDIPADKESLSHYGPIHALLTGHKNEKDRQLKIIQASAYGIVGQKISVKFKVEDSRPVTETTTTVTIKNHEDNDETVVTPVNQEQTVELPIKHAGKNIYEFETGVIDGELTPENNRAAVVVNGVRDRLRVLLVSGQPYAGGRTWRDLLTSDPAVDLVHFTILREPDKLDATPTQELSLIAFPFDELFQVKLNEFDLVIFDCYNLNKILPDYYFDNIVRYVEKGGALLVSSSPSYNAEDSIYHTSLKTILPGAPGGDVIRKSFTPHLSAEGQRHPVTRNLSWSGGTDGSPGWGPWMRQVSLDVQNGEVLMNGADEKPLIILDRVKEGRVAQIASDHIWLWARGYQGGGPHAELLRRMIHWLMKEPDLDEKALDIKTAKNQIIVRSQDYKAPSMDIAMTKPDGTQEVLTLERNKDGNLEKIIDAKTPGIYRFEDPHGQKQFAVLGAINSPETLAILTTPDIIAPAVRQTRGAILWHDETPQPEIKMLPPDSYYGGSGWIGLRQNKDYTVKSVEDTPLLPAWLAAVLLLAFSVFTWWREGRP